MTCHPIQAEYAWDSGTSIACLGFSLPFFNCATQGARVCPGQRRPDIVGVTTYLPFLFPPSVFPWHAQSCPRPVRYFCSAFVALPFLSLSRALFREARGTLRISPERMVHKCAHAGCSFNVPALVGVAHPSTRQKA